MRNYNSNMVKTDLGCVSVIIPTYRRCDLLTRTIESVLGQSYSNIEVIVVDDNSRGDQFRVRTQEIMSQYLDNDRVIYIQHESNINGSAARNTGVKHSVGKYLCFLDNDDLFTSEKVLQQVLTLDSFDEYGATCCSTLSKINDVVYKKSLLKKNESGNYVYELLTGSLMLGAGSTMMIRRSVFDKLTGFDESYSRHQDYEFLVRFFRQHKMYLDENILCYLTVDGPRNYPNACGFMKIKSKFINEFHDDLSKLECSKYNKILSSQWSEVVIAFVSEYKLITAVKLGLNKKIRFNLNFLSQIIIALIPGGKKMIFKIICLIKKQN